MSASAVVGALLQAHSSVVFAKDWCGYCKSTHLWPLFRLGIGLIVYWFLCMPFPSIFFCQNFVVPAGQRLCGLLKSINQPFHYVELEADEVIVGDLRAPASDVQAHLRTLSGKSSVPQLFHKGKFVSDCDGSHALHRSGKLVDILKS
eukprot:m.98603 g.98603  ORF g.98603 m.98603 type:complete len:147 (+) comp51411_c0_seq4:62-502(+)